MRQLKQDKKRRHFSFKKPQDNLCRFEILGYYNWLLDGEAPDLIVTDHPYNTHYGGTILGNGRDIENDNLLDIEIYEFLLVFNKLTLD